MPSAKPDEMPIDYDFFWSGVSKEQLRVTITLAEYRRLLEQTVTDKIRIENLEAELNRMPTRKTVPNTEKEKAEELEMIREKFKDYSGRRCSVFYCDKARDRICCCDCPLLDECPTRNGPCLNDPEHCSCVDERKETDDPN